MYFSPEMLNDATFDPFPADIWALGVTFYFMSTGKFPYAHHSIEVLQKSIMLGLMDFSKVSMNNKVKNLICKMTAKNPSLRPTPQELLDHAVFNRMKEVKISKQLSLISYPPRRSGQLTKSYSISRIKSFSNELNMPHAVQNKYPHKITSYKSADLFPNHSGVNVYEIPTLLNK